MLHRILNNMLFLCVLTGTVWSSSFADIPGAFVDIGFGARPMGMGGAFTAVSNDAQAIFWNPAGLTLLTESELTVMHTKQLGLIPYNLGAFASQVGTHYLGLAFLASGNDVLKENTFFVSYARTVQLPVFGATAFGFNFRYRSSSFGNNEDGGENRSQGDAFGYGIDLGLLWSVDKQTRFGIFARDLFNSMIYNNKTMESRYNEAVPTELILGFSRQVGKNALLALDWQPSIYADTYAKIRLGGEITFFKMLVLRGGLWQNIDAVVNRNYSLGLGLNIKRKNFGVKFDFAYLINDLANAPRISFSIYH